MSYPLSPSTAHFKNGFDVRVDDRAEHDVFGTGRIAELRAELVDGVDVVIARFVGEGSDRWLKPGDLLHVGRDFNPTHDDRLVPIKGDPAGCYCCSVCGGRSFEDVDESSNDYEIQLDGKDWRSRHPLSASARIWNAARPRVACTDCRGNGNGDRIYDLQTPEGLAV